MKANLATSLIAYARGGVRKQLLVLCLLTLCAGNMWAGASWIGKSYIVVNGRWYNADGTGQSNNFDGYNLGHLTSLTLGGEVQTYGQSDGYNNSATMGYQISGQSESSMTLYWYQYKENNNWFHSASGKSSDFAANTIDISGLTPGEYTLSVWFYQADGGVYDSNSNNNYVATFYIDPTITFDQQSGTGGTSSITGPWGAAMPSIKLPSRAGKKFEGYYTGQNGTGTQYYAYNGNSVHTCDFTSNPTLYANWKTPTEYTFYYAAPSDIVADNTVKCYVNYGYDQGSADVNMTATNMTYNNKRIYSVTVTANYQSFDGIYFKPKGWSGDGSEEQAANTSYVAASEINGKIYEHGVGWQTYAEDAPYTVYYVNTNNWTTPKAYAWSSDYDKSVADYASSAAMTKTDYTYNGHDIYTITYTRGFTNVIFNDNASESAKTGNLECYANRDKLYNGSTWQAYGRDVTVYTVPEYLFRGYPEKFSEDEHYPSVCVQYGVGDGEWKTINMDKTDYTYDNYPIWKATFLLDYNIFKEFQIKYFDKANREQVGLYAYNKGGSTEYPSSYLDDKLYYGWNGGEDHDFFSYRYDVALDMQSGGGGSTSIIAIDGSAMPSAEMPGRDGYAFGGYWTETNGGGTQYYNADGSSTRNWDSRTITTLYAHWTPKPYIVTLEGMEADSDDPIMVNVTYDAVLQSLETKHTKAHYDFGGYYTGYDNVNKVVTGSKLIEANGNWILDVAGYTGNDGEGHPTWIHDFNISLFAKWTEHPYKINLVVSPEGAGTIDKGATIEAYYVTASDEITATPGTGYSFGEWDFSKTGEDNDVSSADDYTSTSNPIRIKAQHDGTLTAKFTANNYNVNLENLDADEGNKGTENVSVTYNSSANLTENITIPQKAHYDFGGYYTGYDNVNKVVTGSQLIDGNGKWIPDVEGYTGNDGEGHPTWIRDGINITLFADWTEHPYTVTTSVSHAGAGTLSCGSSVTAKLVTPSELITATANPAWKFVRWEYGTNVGPADGTGLNNTVQINASVDGTLTAVFEPRFCLVGAKWDNSGNGGMPGWSDYTADFIVNSYTDLSNMNLTCVRFLDPNTTYKFEVYDKVKGQNLGYTEATTFIADQSLLFNTQNNDVLLRVNGYGECTFTISALSDGDHYPTVSVAIPTSHQLNLEWADVRINGDCYKTSDDVGGTVSAQTTESGHNFAIHNGEYVAHGGDITYTATPATGYTFEGWYSNDYNTQFSTTNPYTSSNIQTTENVEAKFVEKATTVTLSNDGHGHVEIDGERASSTTVGITTHRELTAVPDEGYKFDSWTKISGDDITLSSTSENPTTLFGLGAGAVSGQEVRANFDYRWTLKAESDGWGQAEFIIKNISTNASGDVVGYVDISLSANTNYQFTMYDKQESQTYKNGSDQVYYMTNGNSHNRSFATDKRYNCGITTAGAGTYRFIWNITDKKMTVTYPNFVIYRTGDKADDLRAQNTDVESYDGGTISQAIEFRMRVNRLDYWYTLCLPFTVSAVKVWDEEDGQYYDIVPYYRTGDKYYTGHYIIRTPLSTTDFAIENFDSRDRWVDPPSADGYLPSANTPYIIQWHTDGDNYFLNKYISFFGATGQTIPTSMNQGANTSSDETVNIYGNNSMTTGTVCDAYLLDPYYGSDGAWMREEIGTYRSVSPFECFILANPATTAKYRVLRRDMPDDTPTGLDTLSMTEDSVSKVMINNRIYIIRGGKMYTIQGTFVKEVE